MGLLELPSGKVKRAHDPDQLLEPQQLLPVRFQLLRRRARCASMKARIREQVRPRLQDR